MASSMSYNGAVIDVTTFHLRDGADVDAFVVADAALQSEFAYQQPGLLRRTTARNDDGTWLVLSVWASPSHADAGAAALGSPVEPTVTAWSAFVDESTVVSARFTELA